MPSKSDIPYLLLAIVTLFIGIFFILLIYAIFGTQIVSARNLTVSANLSY